MNEAQYDAAFSAICMELEPGEPGKPRIINGPRFMEICAMAEKRLGPWPPINHKICRPVRAC